MDPLWEGVQTAILVLGNLIVWLVVIRFGISEYKHYKRNDQES